MLEYTPLITQGNCVTAAQQTLTLYVGVRIPIPLPEKSTCVSKCFFQLYSPCGEFYALRA